MAAVQERVLERCPTRSADAVAPLLSRGRRTRCSHTS
jgi:hypothetical protein